MAKFYLKHYQPIAWDPTSKIQFLIDTYTHFICQSKIMSLFNQSFQLLSLRWEKLQIENTINWHSLISAKGPQWGIQVVTRGCAMNMGGGGDLRHIYAEGWLIMVLRYV